MKALGSNAYPYPLLAIDEQINGPKGQLMYLNAPVDLRVIQRSAHAAVQHNTLQAADRYEQKQAKKMKKAGMENLKDIPMSINHF